MPTDPQILARIDNIQKLAVDKKIKVSAHAISVATGITYETVRGVMNGKEPSTRTMAKLMVYFKGVPWDELFVLQGNNGSAATDR